MFKELIVMATAIIMLYSNCYNSIMYKVTENTWEEALSHIINRSKMYSLKSLEYVPKLNKKYRIEE